MSVVYAPSELRHSNLILLDCKVLISGFRGFKVSQNRTDPRTVAPDMYCTEKGKKLQYRKVFFAVFV